MSVDFFRLSNRLLCTRFLFASLMFADAFFNVLLAAGVSSGSSTARTADSSLVSTTTELRITETTSALRGKLGWNPAPGHHLYFVGQKTELDQSSGSSKFGIGYNWKIRGRHKIYIRSMNIETAAGKQRTDYGVGYTYRFPVKLFQSSVRMSYRTTGDIQTFTDFSYSMSKNLRKSTGLPLTVSATSRWQRREPDDGMPVNTGGGNVGLKMQLSPSFGLEAGHNVLNNTSASNTNIAAIYRANFSGNKVSVKLGLNNNKAALFSLQTGI